MIDVSSDVFIKFFYVYTSFHLLLLLLIFLGRHVLLFGLTVDSGHLVILHGLDVQLVLHGRDEDGVVQRGLVVFNLLWDLSQPPLFIVQVPINLGGLNRYNTLFEVFLLSLSRLVSIIARVHEWLLLPRPLSLPDWLKQGG